MGFPTAFVQSWEDGHCQPDNRQQSMLVKYLGLEDKSPLNNQAEPLLFNRAFGF